MNKVGSFIFVFLALFLFIPKSENASLELPFKDLSLSVNIIKHQKNKPECSERLIQSLECKELIQLLQKVDRMLRYLMRILCYMFIYGQESNVDLFKFEALLREEFEALSLERHMLVTSILESSCKKYASEINLTPIAQIETSHLSRHEIPLSVGRYKKMYVQTTMVVLHRKCERLNKICDYSQRMIYKVICLQSYFKNLNSISSFAYNVLQNLLSTLYELYPKLERSKVDSSLLKLHRSSSSSDDDERSSVTKEHPTTSKQHKPSKEATPYLSELSDKNPKPTPSEKYSVIKKLFTGMQSSKVNTYTLNSKSKRSSPKLGKAVATTYIPSPGFTGETKPSNSKDVSHQSRILQGIREIPLLQALSNLDISNSASNPVNESKKRYVLGQTERSEKQLLRTSNRRKKRQRQISDSTHLQETRATVKILTMEEKLLTESDKCYKEDSDESEDEDVYSNVNVQCALGFYPNTNPAFESLQLEEKSVSLSGKSEQRKGKCKQKKKHLQAESQYSDRDMKSSEQFGSSNNLSEDLLSRYSDSASSSKAYEDLELSDKLGGSCIYFKDIGDSGMQPGTSSNLKDDYTLEDILKQTG